MTTKLHIHEVLLEYMEPLIFVAKVDGVVLLASACAPTNADTNPYATVNITEVEYGDVCNGVLDVSYVFKNTNVQIINIIERLFDAGDDVSIELSMTPVCNEHLPSNGLFLGPI